MPKATAVWLVDNTSLSFEQIADFCRLHPLEVKGIADGEVAAGIKGIDPIANGQLTREEIERARGRSRLPPEARRPKVQAARGASDQEGPALHPGVAPPGPAERHPLAAAQPSRAQGRADHAPRRHHQVDDPAGARAHALELGQLAADGPGDARPLPRRSTSISRSSAPPRTGPQRAAEGGQTLLPAEVTTAPPERTTEPSPRRRRAGPPGGEGSTPIRSSPS